MKSSVFRDFARLSKRFTEDLNSIGGFEDAQLALLLERMPKIVWAKTGQDESVELDTLVKEVKGDVQSLLRIVDVLDYIAHKWDEFSDTLDNFIYDLDQLAIIQEDRREKVKDFLVKYIRSIDRDKGERLRRTFSSSVIPNIRGVTAVVDFRAVMNNVFKPTSMRIAEYTSSCLGFVPKVILKVSSDADQGKPILVQLEKDELIRTIDSLKAALKDLEGAEAYLTPTKGKS